MNAPVTRPCAGPVHDYPLPEDLASAAAEAARRRAAGWQIAKCDLSGCVRYGWIHPDDVDPTGGR